MDTVSTGIPQQDRGILQRLKHQLCESVSMFSSPFWEVQAVETLSQHPLLTPKKILRIYDVYEYNLIYDIYIYIHQLCVCVLFKTKIYSITCSRRWFKHLQNNSGVSAWAPRRHQRLTEALDGLVDPGIGAVRSVSRRLSVGGGTDPFLGGSLFHHALACTTSSQIFVEWLWNAISG